jgi:protein NrfD
MPPEIGLVGDNGLLSTWGWQVAVYLFLGGLVAGLMIFSAVLRLLRPGHFKRALLVADLAGLPLLGAGMLFLLLDLSNMPNFWRLFTTFQVTSPMSWGSWILLVTMLVLALRFFGVVPATGPAALAGLKLFPPPAVDEAPPAGEEAAAPVEGTMEAAQEKAAEKTPPKRPAAALFVEKLWTLGAALSAWIGRFDKALTLPGLLLGTGVGFYTGILLSTIPARPLWNTAVLAPLFLVSGMASAGAFLCLFLPHEEHVQLAPFSVLLCGVELILLLAYGIYLNTGTLAVQRSGALLLQGTYGWIFWLMVVVFGLLVPATLEQLELMHRRIPLVQGRVPPVLKLVGGLSLRFVIVYAGMLSFL